MERVRWDSDPRHFNPAKYADWLRARRSTWLSYEPTKSLQTRAVFKLNVLKIDDNSKFLANASVNVQLNLAPSDEIIPAKLVPLGNSLLPITCGRDSISWAVTLQAHHIFKLQQTQNMNCTFSPIAMNY